MARRSSKSEEENDAGKSVEPTEPMPPDNQSTIPDVSPIDDVE